MKSRFRFCVLVTGLIGPIEVSHGKLVGTIDTGGTVDVAAELGSFSLEAMRTLITSTDNLELAGVLNAEGDFTAGNFSRDEGALSDKITGASRNGRDGGVDTKASGVRWGFINGAAPEVWTPDVGLYHFGLITTPLSADNHLTITVTYSDSTAESVTASASGVTAWIGFYKSRQTITSISLLEVENAAFANYDNVSLAFVEAPSEEAPTIDIARSEDGGFSISFTGVLQQSGDPSDWNDLDPAPISPFVLPAENNPFFYRSRRP